MVCSTVCLKQTWRQKRAYNGRKRYVYLLGLSSGFSFIVLAVGQIIVGTAQEAKVKSKDVSCLQNSSLAKNVKMTVAHLELKKCFYAVSICCSIRRVTSHLSQCLSKIPILLKRTMV